MSMYEALGKLTRARTHENEHAEMVLVFGLDDRIHSSSACRRGCCWTPTICSREAAACTCHGDVETPLWAQRDEAMAA
jgi:hypothetical protein